MYKPSMISLFAVSLALMACQGVRSTAPGEATARASAPAAWPLSGLGVWNNRHQPFETVLDATNVGRLVLKWSASLQGNVVATPAVEAGFLYVPDSAGFLYKLDAETGGVVWSRAMSTYTGIAGDSARATPAITATALVVGNQPPCDAQPVSECGRATLVAVDKQDGSLLWRTTLHEFPGSSVTQGAIVQGDEVIVGVASGEESMAQLPGYPCCSFKGRLLAVGLADGRIRRQYQTVPDAAGFAGAAVWGSTPVADAARGNVYITTGNDYAVPESVSQCIERCLSNQCDTDGIRDCLSATPGNHFDSILALDATSFELRWSFAAMLYDAWNNNCVSGDNPQFCSEPAGPDFDFAQGPMLIPLLASGRQLVGAGQKNGVFWALDPDTGELVWSTRVGPGGAVGGMLWGSATDGVRVYTANSNSIRNYWQLEGTGTQGGLVVARGFWSALDAETGEILWQTPEPDSEAYQRPITNRGSTFGPKGAVSVTNGVVFASTTTPGGADLFALDARNGDILWRYDTGGTVSGGAAIVDGTVYWGALAPPSGPDEHHSSYLGGQALPSGAGTVFAFCVAGTSGCSP